MPEEAERLALDGEVPALRAGLITQGLVGRRHARPIASAGPSNAGTDAGQLLEQGFEAVGDARQGRGRLRPQLGLGVGEALSKRLQASHAPLNVPEALTLPAVASLG